MQAMEICRKFYESFGKRMIEENFPEYANRIAVGLCGQGSECLGFDDQISADHDYEVGFCIFLTKEDEKEIGFKLERAYAKLPREFMGLKRQTVSAVGGNRRGVMTIDDFYARFLGSTEFGKDISDWFYLPPHALLNASNGEVFYDGLGEFSAIRNAIKKGYPDDVRKKKISACLINMAQSGQYNYERTAKRGETGASQLAIFEFVKHAISVIYLLNNAYEPYYKWAYKGLRNLDKLSDLEFSLIGLTEQGNSPREISQKLEIIEDVSKMIITELKAQGLTKATCNNLETHAYSVQDGICSPQIRNMNIFDGI